MKWRESALAEIAKRDKGLVQTGPFGSQLHQSDYQPDGIPVIMPKDICAGRISTDSIARISEETVQRLSRHVLKPKSIVFPRRGEITKRAYITEDEAGWLCGTGCLKIELAGEEVLPEFLFYYLELDHVVRWLEQHAVGTTMLNLSASILGALPVKYPDIVAQRRIADILSAYDDLIENNRRRMALLEESARQLYREWFVRLRFPGHEHTPIKNGIPEGWERKTLAELCVAVREAVHPEDVESDTPYIGLEHMPRRSISLSEWGKAEDVTSTKHQFRAGDILFGKIRPYFHKVGVAFVDGVASSDAIVIQPAGQAVYGLVLMTVSSDAFIATTSQTMREGSKMPRADWKQMADYPVSLPPHGLLDDFNSIVTSIVDQLRTLTFQNQKLRAARDLLLPRLMNGEIAV